MEKSLRRALDAGDASDPQFRDSIYTASERALERLLRENPIDEEMAHARRVRLAETINRIEADYFGTFGTAEGERSDEAVPADAMVTVVPETPINRDDEERFVAESEGSLQGDREALPPSWAGGQDDLPLSAEAEEAAEPAAGRAATKGVAWSPKASGGRRPAPAIPPRVRAWLPAILAVLVVLLAALYFLSGAVLSPLSSEGETAAGTAAASAEWISIFDGTQLGIIATPSGGTVDSVTVRGDPAVRLAPAGEGGEINVAIGPGVVREIQGQTVRVELVAGSSDGASREFGVRCLFGGETVCARQRFQTTQARDTFVFDMAVPRGGNAAGVLAIDPTLAAATGDLDLYSIRLQPVPAS
jgi:hypothetical protein